MLKKLNQPLNLVINLQVPEEIILERIMGMYTTNRHFPLTSWLIKFYADRWIHSPSGRVYNLSYNPPRIAGLDDVTGEPLTKRPDDNPEVFRVRMKQYKNMVKPLLDHYADISVTVQGNTSDEIYPQIEREIVNRLGHLPGALSVPSSTIVATAAVSRYKRQLMDSQTQQKPFAAAAAAAANSVH